MLDILEIIRILNQTIYKAIGDLNQDLILDEDMGKNVIYCHNTSIDVYKRQQLRSKLISRNTKNVNI